MATQVISLFGRVTLIDNFSGPMNRLVGNATRTSAIVGKAMVGMGAATATIGAISIKTAATFESSFTGVRKTVDATEAEFDKLRQGILKMATDATNPVAGLPNAQNALAGIMEQAGQLGIRGVDNLLKFTETIGKLQLSTNLGADAAIKLARLLNITGEDTSNIDRIAASIVALGNNLATTEDEIAQMSLRIAGAATVAGLTTQEILALAGSASALGLRAEMGGSALARIFNQMAEAIGKGGDKLDAFGALTGKTASEFAQTFKGDALQAFSEVILGISKLDATKQAEGLDAIGLSGIRVSDAMRRLALDVAGTEEALDLVNVSYEENNAHNVEAERRLDTVNAQWNVTKNQLRDLGIQIGDKLLPVVRDFLTLLQRGLTNAGPVIDSFLVLMEIGIQNAIDLMPLFEALWDGITTKITEAKNSVKEFFFGSDGFLTEFEKANGTIEDSFANLPAAMGAGGRQGLESMNDAFAQASSGAGHLNETMAEAFDRINNTDTSTMAQNAGHAESMGDAFARIRKDEPSQGLFGKMRDALMPVVQIVATLADWWGIVKQVAVDSWNEIEKAADRVWTFIMTAATIAWNAISSQSDTVFGTIDLAMQIFEDSWENIKEAAGRVFTWIEDNLPDLSFITDALSDLGIIGGELDGLRRFGDTKQGAIVNQALKGTGLNAGSFGGGGVALDSILQNLPGGPVNLGANISGSGGRTTFKDTGGRFAAGVPQMIGTGAQPEMFIPDTAGTAIPNAKMGGGMSIGNINIYANSEAEGRAAARGFTDELMRHAAKQGINVMGITG